MAGGEPWTQDEAEFLARLWVVHQCTNEEAYAQYQERWPGRRGYAAIAAARTKVRMVADAVSQMEVSAVTPTPTTRQMPDGPTVTEFRKPEMLDPDAEWAAAKRRTKATIAYHETRHQVELAFRDTKPIGISFISDQHIAQGGAVALDRMERDARLICNTSGLYAVLGGDGVDNHIKHKAAMVNSESRPAREWELYDHYLGFFGHSLVAGISGNHDDWTQDFAGVDVVSQLFKRRKLVFAPDFIVLTVRIQDGPEDEGQVYRVKVRHQFRYESSFNKGHSIKRMWEMDQHDFDVGVLCHKHEPHMEPFIKHGQMRIALRPGSYQIVTGHSRRYGFANATPTCPTVILWPGRREMMGFWDVRHAASYLRWLRKGWPETGAEVLGEAA